MIKLLRKLCERLFGIESGSYEKTLKLAYKELAKDNFEDFSCNVVAGNATTDLCTKRFRLDLNAWIAKKAYENGKCVKRIRASSVPLCLLAQELYHEHSYGSFSVRTENIARLRKEFMDHLIEKYKVDL